MSGDDEFEPRLGKARAVGGRARPYLSRVLGAAMLASGGRFGRAPGRRGFTGARLGRGAGVAAVLAAGDHRAGLRGRRVVVKISTPRLAGKGMATARAHLRYIQRDGVMRDGSPGQLYGADADRADGRAFLDRAQEGGDVRQFRMIVSPEDGAEYDDLKPLIRRLMRQAESDLGTRLDWVAADHHNTGHPHTHVLIRGRDDQGHDLIIAKDYLTRGLRERAQELVSVDLGPVTDEEISQRLHREAQQERLTSLDRGLLAAVDGEGLVSPRHPDPLQYAARASRLQFLARLGLAHEAAPTTWRLAEGLEETLRRMGERGDIQKTLYRALAEVQVERAVDAQVVFEPRAPDQRPLVGRLLRRGLADEIRDRHFLVVDGVDGRAHYVDLGRGGATETIPEDAVVRVLPRSLEARPADRVVAEVAVANDGRYSLDLHLAQDPAATAGFAQAHLRRLEALRRGGAGVERADDGTWMIPADHLERAAAFERKKALDAPVVVEVLSPLPLDRQATALGPTWLDRELLAETPEPLRDAGFGRAARQALSQRRQWLLQQDLAEQEGDRTLFRAGMLRRLEVMERAAVARGIAADTGLAYAPAQHGDRVEGILRRRFDLNGGPMALVEKSREFTLVPWRPVLEGREGQVVTAWCAARRSTGRSGGPGGRRSDGGFDAVAVGLRN